MPETIATNGSSDLRNAKAAMRRAAVQGRNLITKSDREAASVAVATRMGELLINYPKALIVSGFLPIGDEIDPRPALELARAAGRRICLPVMVNRNEPLSFRAWQPADPMVERQWGIREPVDSAELMEPDLLLTPLLAFDEQGGRLGYGGGYYDRTLARLRRSKPIVAVGLAYEVQRVDSVPCLDYDERLDWVLTPARMIACSVVG